MTEYTDNDAPITLAAAIGAVEIEIDRLTDIVSELLDEIDLIHEEVARGLRYRRNDELQIRRELCDKQSAIVGNYRRLVELLK